jgi:hypothetical protein
MSSVTEVAGGGNEMRIPVPTRPASVCLTAEEIIRVIKGEVVNGVEMDFYDTLDPLKLGLIDDAVLTRIDDLYDDDEDDE